jgi:hypothetical protein
VNLFKGSTSLLANALSYESTTTTNWTFKHIFYKSKHFIKTPTTTTQIFSPPCILLTRVEDGLPSSNHVLKLHLTICLWKHFLFLFLKIFASFLSKEEEM